MQVDTHQIKVILRALGLLSVLLFCSCDIQKQAAKTKTEKDLTETIRTQTKRLGDTVRFEVPKVVLKDTTIYTYNRVGTRIETRYNSQGQIDLIECMSSSIDELKEENRRILETVKEKESEKTENFDSDFILYFMIGLGLLIVIVGGAFFYVMTRQSKAVMEVLKNISP